jgi:hypothetical protein
MFVGGFCWWMVFDWPGTARFLSPEDRIRVRRRLAADNQSNAAEEYDRRHITAALKDWKCWGFAVIYMGCLMPLYAFSLFLPTILAGMGYAGTQAQLLSVPPYAVAATVTIIVGWVGDRTRQRGILNMIVVSIGIAGFIMVSHIEQQEYSSLNTKLTIVTVNRLRQPPHPIRRNFPRRHRSMLTNPIFPSDHIADQNSSDIPYRPQHPFLVQQQHRRRLQARRDHRNRRRSGQRQWSGLVQHFPQRREAEVLHRPRHSACIHVAVLARRHRLHVDHAQAREFKEAER